MFQSLYRKYNRVFSILPKIFYQASSLRRYPKSPQTKPKMHEKTSGDKLSKKPSIAFSTKNHLQAKKRTCGIKTKGLQLIKTITSLTLPSTFLLLCSSLFSFTLLRKTTRTRASRQLQSRKFQQFKVNKIPRTKLIRL